MTARPLPADVASLVLLAAWLGAALLVAAVVAPAAFAVLPSRGLAGALVGRVLPVMFWGGIAVGLAVAALGWPQPARTAAALALAAACAAAQLLVTPRIARLRAEIGGAVDALDPGDPRRRAFGALHGLSVAGMGVGGLAAMVALALIVRALAARSGT